MTQRLLFLYGFILLFFAADIAQAQSKRATGLFINPRVGLSTYGGDRDQDPGEDFVSLKIAEHFKSASYSLGGEIGYGFSPAVSISIGLQFANYPEISQNFEFDDGRAPVLSNNSSNTRLTIPVYLRWMVLPSKRLSPYAHIGGNLSFASFELADGGSSSETAFGPILGVGLDYVLSNHASLFIETTGFYGFGDDKLDAADPGTEGDETDFDLLGFYGLGVRYSFNPACAPIQVLSVDGPARVEIGQPATYTATINDDACDPESLVWDFGDGNTATGLTVTHSFAEPGDYNVTFTATNSGGSDSGSVLTNAFDPCPAPAQIVSISSNPEDPIIGESIRFTASVQGTEPHTYSWNFGDGGTSTANSPSHTYSEPGEYTVALDLSNCGGNDNRTLNLMIREFRCEDITELNTVFFDRNSSELDDEARALLDENIAVLRECGDILVRIDGFADRGERRTQALSEARAKAVEQYYIENGIAPSRLMARGLGRDPLAGKGVDGRRNRRADSIIVDGFDQ